MERGYIVKFHDKWYLDEWEKGPGLGIPIYDESDARDIAQSLIELSVSPRLSNVAEIYTVHESFMLAQEANIRYNKLNFDEKPI